MTGRSFESRVPLLALVLGVLGLLSAFANQFLQDDAFISFQFARAWVEGDGLTWFGSKVEGYTNFLWVAWIAVGLEAGLSAPFTAHLGSLVAYAFTLRLTWLFMDKESGLTRLFALALLVTNGTFLAYATGGLETMVQTALLMTVARAAFDPHTSTRPAGYLIPVSIAAGLALMTRMDSAVLLMPLGIQFVWHLRKADRPLRSLFILVGPALLILGAWLGWKISYYGDIFPNTYYAKVGGWGDPTGNGATYVWRYLEAYTFWPILAVGVPLVVWKRTPQDTPLLWALASVACWVGYVIHVGGDFMEFRFLVPCFPLLAFVLARLAVDVLGARILQKREWMAGILAVLFLLSSTLHRETAAPTTDFALDTIDGLGTFYGLYPQGDWDRVGKPLGEALEGTDPLIALHAVGAIPYYSRLRTLDMFGLTDRQVAESGALAPETYLRPGHRKIATLAHLKERNVNLIFGAPTVLPTAFLTSKNAQGGIQQWPQSGLWFQDIPGQEATVLAIPISSEESILAWYLTPTPALTARIQETAWPQWTVRAGSPPSP